MEFHRILVGIELDPDTGKATPGSDAAFRQAVAFAAGAGAELTLLHSTWDEPTDTAGAPTEAVSSELAALAKKSTDAHGVTADVTSAVVVPAAIPVRPPTMPGIAQ